MSHGGFHPFPRRFGGNKYAGNKPLLEVVQDSLSAQRGEAFNSDDSTTIVWVENHAYARAITFDGWGTNERLSLQWDPRRTTDMLERWERIFRLRPGPNDTEKDRRDALVARWQRFGVVANHAKYTTALEAALGDYFYAVEYISVANAVVTTPTSGYPWGTANTTAPWTSTVCHILVRMQLPTGATEGEFAEMAAKVPQVLDPIVPAICTFDWYREPETGAPVSVSGGPSAAGWCLDERNLDSSCFDA